MGHVILRVRSRTPYAKCDGDSFYRLPLKGMTCTAFALSFFYLLNTPTSQTAEPILDSNTSKHIYKQTYAFCCLIVPKFLHTISTNPILGASETSGPKNRTLPTFAINVSNDAVGAGI